MSKSRTSPAVKRAPTERNQADSTLYLRNSTVRLETGPGGTIARIDHERRAEPDFAGPLDESTIDALRRVASRGERR